MDKESLLEVVKNSNVKTADEVNELFALRTQFPYSQVLQILSAKVSKEQNLPAQQTELQHAAVYASDRHVLKEIMMRPARIQAATQAIATQELPVAEDSTPAVSEAHQEGKRLEEAEIEKAIETFDVAETIMRDLEKLHRSKHEFEMLFADQNSMSTPETLIPEIDKATPAELYHEDLVASPNSEVVPASETDNVSESPAPEATKSKRAKIIELARSLNAAADSQTAAVPGKKKKKDGPHDHFIEQIKTNKQEIELETERQKEQIQIIDHFIKTQPSISSPKEKANLPANDLNLIKSGEFGDNIVSETLVEILVKQGKKDRAIEVLKKLIWKYPQKKAYFASQIEELKK